MDDEPFCEVEPDAPSQDEVQRVLAYLSRMGKPPAPPVRPVSAVTLPDAIGAYLGFLGGARERAPRTVQEYRRELEGFASWVAGEGRAAPPDGGSPPLLALVLPDDIDHYHAARVAARPGNHQRTPRSAEVSPARRAWRFTVLRSFFRWAADRYGLPRSPVSTSLRPASPPPPPPIYLDREGVERLLALAAEDLETLALAALMVGTGARISEAARLRLGDLHLDRDCASAVLHGKGGKTRTVVVVPELADILSRWVERGVIPACPHRHAATPVFASERAPGWRALTIVGIGKRLHKLFARMAAEREGWRGLSAHKLRHTFAVTAMLRGVSLVTVQQMLGHALLTTTQIYTQLQLHDVRADLEAHNPLPDAVRLMEGGRK